MHRFLSSLLLGISLFGLSGIASATQLGGGDGPKPLDPRAFFAAVKGAYRIELAGGTAPHGAEPTASIELESQDALVRVPYCFPSGACDPGYLMMPLREASVVQDGFTYLISVNDSGQRLRYSWRIDGNRVYFRNYQFRVDDHTFITLEHVLQRKVDID